MGVLECPLSILLRTIHIEKRLAEQEQYTRRECVELVGLPENIDGGDLENAVIDAFEEAGVRLEKRDFHAVHRLRNKKVVIAKLVNRRDATVILRNKKKLRELNNDAKKKLKSNKIYVNESLCPAYRRILGKCNALAKKGKLVSFFTINGKIKIKITAEGRPIEITHEVDLIELFGCEIINEINAERERNN